MKETGLVVEGGGMRGIYAAGVLDVFMDHGIVFDGVIGVSAGAIHAVSYLSEQRGRNLRYYKKYCTDPRFFSIRNYIFTGDVVGVDFSYNQLPNKLDLFDYEKFAENASKVAFYSTCSNLETGEAEYLRMTDGTTQMDLLRASATLPYLSKIVECDGKKLLDGGCTDSIPVKAMINMGYKKNVVILTRDASYKKKPSGSFLPKLFYGKKYPKFAKALIERAERYNQSRAEIQELEKNGDIFVFCPSEPLVIGRLEHDPEKLQKVYDIGYKDGLNRLASMQQWLGHKED